MHFPLTDFLVQSLMKEIIFVLAEILTMCVYMYVYVNLI